MLVQVFGTAAVASSRGVMVPPGPSAPTDDIISLWKHEFYFNALDLFESVTISLFLDFEVFGFS